jgi:transcriptional regulator with PAS, ATPase and Fis domain
LLESFPLLGKSALDAVLHEGQQILSLIIKLKDRDVVTNIEPIVLEKEIIGAVITIQEGKKIHEIAEELRKELYAHGFVASMRFEKLPASRNPAYADMIAKAEKAAENSAPVLIFGEEGTELLAIAQCIHNAGSRSSCGFVEVDCNAWEPDCLDEMLFGVKRRVAGEYYDRSLIDKAEDGTLFLNGVESLTAELQYKICKLVRGTLHLNGENRQMPANVRVIAGTTAGLKVMKDSGRIGSDFFYTFSVQTLEIPPLRQRSEDIEGLADYFLSYYGGLYSKPVRLTRDALGFMKVYSWPGNLRQLDNFCHRLVLQTTRRSMDEAFVRSQLAKMEPCPKPEASLAPQQAKDTEALRLIEALKRNRGSRLLTAKELGISTTTLWRRMMKHGITREHYGG